MDELLQEIADRTGVPIDMIERSAAARAEASGVGVEDILRTWAGGAVPDAAAAAAPEPTQVSAPPEAAAAPPEPVPSVPVPQETVGAAAPTPNAPVSTGAPVASAGELIPLAADKTGVPADLLERAAAARAQASGVAVEEVLSGWTGAEIAPVATATPPPTPAAPVAEPAPSPAVTPVEPSAEPEPAAPVDDGLRVEVFAPDDNQMPDAADAPDEEGRVEEPAASVLSGFPRWLAASFVLLPIIAMLYVLNTPNAPDCGSAGQLAVDPATGLAVNCDGSPYGAELVDFFSMGEGLYAAKCAACHSLDGSGGVGPPLAAGAVLATFPKCADHAAWVELGTSGWPDAVYGATNKPVGGFGVMPGFGNDPSLTSQDLAALSLYERVAFGLQPLADAETDCGLTGVAAVAP